MSKNQQYLIKITVTAILSAAAMIINRFLSFNVWNMSIGISFIPVLVCGLLFGPLWGGVCGALADFIGALLFPFGPYFFGFTATAFISGVFYGLPIVLTKKKTKPFVFAIYCFVFFLLNELVCTLTLNSLWIELLYSGEFWPILITRIPKSAVDLVLGVLVGVAARFSIIPPIQKVLSRNS